MNGSNFSLTPRSYYADFLTVPIAIAIACGWFLKQGGTLRSARFASAAIAGGLAWSLMEYLIHRFVFHRIEPYKYQHHLHHIGPPEFIGVSPVVTIMLFIGLGFALPGVLGPTIGIGFYVGALAWYLAYIAMHTAYHQMKTPPGWLARLRDNHDWHHARPQFNFGVSSPLWDLVFHTYARPPMRVRRR